MIQDSIHTSPYKGSGQITREQFLFYEMRTTAKLLIAGHDEKDTIDTIISYLDSIPLGSVHQRLSCSSCPRTLMILF